MMVSLAGAGAEELVVLSAGVDEELVVLSAGVVELVVLSAGVEELVVSFAGVLADWLAVSFMRRMDELVVFVGTLVFDGLAADMQEQRKVVPRNKTNRFRNSLDSICTKPRQVRCAKD